MVMRLFRDDLAEEAQPAMRLDPLENIRLTDAESDEDQMPDPQSNDEPDGDGPEDGAGAWGLDSITAADLAAAVEGADPQTARSALDLDNSEPADGTISDDSADAERTNEPAIPGNAPDAAAAKNSAATETADDPGEADGPATEIDPGLCSVLEALLLSTHHPLTAARLAGLLDLDSTGPIRPAVKQLNEQYAAAGRSFRIEQVAGGYQILTLPEFGEVLKKLHLKEADAKLTKAALETLSIIAYKQPILRAEVEAIRGVACGETIRSLMEKHLVKIAGRAEEPGRPILYGTTRRFLELFGLNSLKDLPQPEGTEKPKG